MVWHVSSYCTVKFRRTGLARTQFSLPHKLQPDGAPRFTRFTHQKPANNAAENVTVRKPDAACSGREAGIHTLTACPDNPTL